MCGFAGYSINKSSNEELPDLTAVVRALEHRGPDGKGTYVDDATRTGLAHTRLSIIDTTDNGSQPMLSSSSNSVLSYNGEIYNHETLRAKLLSNVNFKSSTDTEVLINLLERHGDQILSQLNGIFAFAYFNRNDNRILLARDPYGVKPLYYHESNSGVFFGSEIKSILAMGISPTKPAPKVLAQYMTYLWNPGPDACADNIQMLEPGSLLVVENGRVVEKREYVKTPIRTSHATNSNEKAVISKLQDTLEAAVARQLMTDVPLGAFLSGGLDSSAVVALAAKSKKNLTCFTIDASGSSETGMVDDLGYARKVAKHHKVDLQEVKIEPDQMAKDLEKLIYHLEEPLADPAGLNVLYICEAARRRGIKVLLSGSGGDDVFTGYRRHQALRLDQTLYKIPVSARKVLNTLGQRISVSHPTARRLRKYLLGIDLSPEKRLINYFKWISKEDVLQLFNENLRKELQFLEFDEDMLRYLSECDSELDTIKSALALEQRFFLCEHNLIYTDKMSMACGVEVRVPFLDIDLNKSVSEIPSNMLQRGKEGKWVLKKAMEDFLPRDVIYRPKTGFGAPIRSWLKGELRWFMMDLLSKEAILNRGFFDPEAVHRLINVHETGKRDVAYTIFSLMCIEIWCRIFIDRKQPQFI